MVAVPNKIAYFDCFSGISGDMCLGALVDAGVSLHRLKRELKKIPVSGYELEAKRVKRAGLVATKVDVVLTPLYPPLLRRELKGGKGKIDNRIRKWKDIEKIIQDSTLSQDIKQKGLKVFRSLFEAEAKVHGRNLGDIHLHELGAVDSIVDIFGTIIGLEMLGIEKVYTSPVNLGSGTIKTQHGILPVPAPAVTEILKGVPVYSSDTEFELTTPTGAVIVKSLSSGFGEIPVMHIKKTGIGAGSKDFNERPNVLRLFIGELCSTPLNSPLTKGGYRGVKNDSVGLSDEKITVIETNIDDMNPQIYEYVMEKLFKAGALDVYLTQVLMKKGRPSIKLTVLCHDDNRDSLIKIILRETTTIGVRFYTVNRVMLQRGIKELDTEFGKVRIKISRLGKEILKATPEYEDCKKIAKKTKMPIFEVMRRISTKLNNKILNSKF